ncbi:acyl carrier protein [Nocardiopsis sp. LOL_012]|uniref:acyl carrier protein n=1 Tax=Nocardiopsis sp. LOL_012 TaxID=3345409 RepID=UPI003A86C40C
MTDHKPEIRKFFSQFFEEARLGDDEDIFAAGFVNSLFITQLVVFVETHFGVTVEDEDLEIENFNTLGAIDALIGRKQAAHAASQ